MRLTTFRGAGGLAGIGVLQGGGIVDLGRAAPDLPRDMAALLALGPAALAAAAAAAAAAGPDALLDPAAVEYLPVVPAPGKLLCAGMNYADHVAEAGAELPGFPVFFLRTATSVTGHGQPLLAPAASPCFDYEAELAAVIGRRGRNIPAAAALDHVAGYTLFNDGSIRDFQLERGPQWTMGKNFDRTAALGPVLVTADELPPGGRGLAIRTRVNGRLLQDGNTADMVFGVADLIAYVSTAMTLEPGDVIATGTPAGVGFARTPPVFLRAGDICEVEVEGIGTLRNPVEAE